MIYIGLGNSGSKILWDCFEFLFQKEASAYASTELAQCRFLIGDADTNNSVLHQVRQRRLDKATPPQSINLLDLSRFWSGGCGVYHIIGELLADTAVDDPDFVEMMASYGRNLSATLLMSAGGGTGGGVGGFFRENSSSTRLQNVRVFSVLPELDQFREGGTEISGPDSYQNVSSGRFLLKFLSDTTRSRAEQDANPSNQSDLFLLSNSYLACIPPTISFQDGVKRLNKLLAHCLVMMPSSKDYPTRQRVVTFGLGATPRTSSGENKGTLDQLAKDLVRTALTPVDLSHHSPTGLSALPMELSRYNPALNALLSNTPNAGGNDLAQVFQRCLGVDAFLYYKRADGEGTNINQLRQQIQAELMKIFGENMPVNVWNGGQLPATYIPEMDQPGRTGDFALLLLLDDLMVEDVFRLVTYFLESSYEWQDGTVTDVADLIHNILGNSEHTAQSIQDALTGTRSSGANKVRLRPDAREAYEPRFWGNIDDLKSKVLQSLNRQEHDFDARRLTVSQLARALAFFHEQIWRYRS